MKRVAVAGGFDPLHVGHLRHIKAAKELGDQLTVILNSDDDMIRKKGYCFMPLSERMEIVGSLRFVDQVLACLDNDGTVTRTLKWLKPDIFAKGGDRRPDNMPRSELEVCKQIGCQIIYGVGGGKVESSSNLVKRRREAGRHRRSW